MKRRSFLAGLAGTPLAAIAAPSAALVVQGQAFTEARLGSAMHGIFNASEVKENMGNRYLVAGKRQAEIMASVKK